MNFYIFIHIWLATGIKLVFTDCGTIYPQRRNVIEGEKVQLNFVPKYGRSAESWYFNGTNSTHAKYICWNSISPCVSVKYHLCNNILSIENFTKRDEGWYYVRCDKNLWSVPAALNSQPADTRANKEQHVHVKNHSMTHSVTATVVSKTEKTKVIAYTCASKEQQVQIKVLSRTHSVSTAVEDSAKDYKVSSTLEDTSQVTTLAFAGGVAVGVMVTVIVVVIIHKKRKKDDIHQAGKASDPTQTISEGVGDQDRRLQNDSNRLHRRDRWEQEAPVAQHKQKNNSDQQASGTETEQIDSKYETIIPVTDRAMSIQEKEMYKIIKVEEKGIPAYEIVS